MKFPSLPLPLPLLLLITLISTTLSTANSPPPPSPSPSPSFPPSTPPPSSPTLPPPSDLQEKQISNIIDALVGAGDFAGWATFLSTLNTLSFPLKATLFIPNNDALSSIPPATASGVSVDPSLVAYHIIPQHLTFKDLKQLPIHSRIPTLLSSNFLIITSTTSNFTIDGAEITHPDIYISSAFSVHGVSKVLDYKAYGGINITFTEEDAKPEGKRPNKKEDKKKKKKKRKKRKDSEDDDDAPSPSSTAILSSRFDFVMGFLVLGIGLFFLE